MKLKEINKPIKEYRNVVTPRDETHYREMMKTLHNLELKSASDPETMAEIKRRKMELRSWAEKNLKTEDTGDIGNYAREIATGKIVRIVDYTDDDEGIYTISYGDGKGETDVLAKDLKFIDPTVHQDLGQVGEGMIGDKMEYNDFLQNKLDTAMQEYDTPEKQQARAELMKKYLAKGGKVEKVPAGQTAYKGKELKPQFKKDNGTPTTSPGSDESAVKEEAPFGSGMELLRMAIMKKFITVQEWDLLKHKWKAAADEVEQQYSDWPDGEGFGSSDHNFAIKDLMTAVGYEFDDQDTSGSFVVTKQPEEIEKAGIKNARMRDAVATQEDDGLQPVDLKRLGQNEPQIYVHKDGKTILIPKRKHNEYLAKGWKTSSLRAETQSYESKLVDQLNQRLK